MMCVPLLYKNEMLGVVYTDNVLAERAFSPEDLELLNTLGHQAAIAVANARLVDEMKREVVWRANLQRYLPAHLAEKIVDGDIALHLGGHFRKVTVLFADLVEFTPLTEKLTPETLVQVLNDFFTLMVEVIFRFEGSVDKFMGDCVMAVWGAPLKTSMDELLAVHAALEMQAMLYLFNRRLAEEGLPVIRMRIGINTGVAVAGNIGSEQRMEYTVIGDAVNLAQRVEAQAGPGQIFISDGLYREVAPFIRAFEVGTRTLKGKSEPVTIYSVRGLFPREQVSNGMEKRRGKRMEVSIEALCRDDENQQDFSVLITNLSRGGSGIAVSADVFARAPVKEGAALAIQFMLDEIPEVLHAKGRIRRISETANPVAQDFFRIGIEFTELAPATKAILAELWKDVD
jgi:class 3 adenylate cyclase